MKKKWHFIYIIVILILSTILFYYINGKKKSNAAIEKNNSFLEDMINARQVEYNSLSKNNFLGFIDHYNKFHYFNNKLISNLKNSDSTNFYFTKTKQYLQENHSGRIKICEKYFAEIEFIINSNFIDEVVKKNILYCVENCALDAFYEFDFINNQFVFDGIDAISVPIKNPIRLGEEYRSQIFAIGLIKKFPYKVIIQNDTIKEYKNNLPYFVYKPTKRGKNIVKAKIFFNWYDKRKLTLPFEINIDVE
jgi:hypothetical protein